MVGKAVMFLFFRVNNEFAHYRKRNYLKQDGFSSYRKERSCFFLTGDVYMFACVHENAGKVNGGCVKREKGNNTY